MKSVENAAAAN